MTRTKIPIDNRPPFRRRFRPTTLRRLSARPSRHIRVHTRHPVIQRVTPCRTHFARSLSGPSVREICNQMPNPSISAPPPRSYRLRRHFPRHCDVTTRVLHPYKPRFLRKEGTAGSPAAAPSSRHFTARYRNCSCPAFSHGHMPSASRLVSGILRRRAGRRTRTSCAGRIPAATDSPPGRKTDFRIPGFPASENITSLLSSRRESGPSKPSRGTGYG